MLRPLLPFLFLLLLLPTSPQFCKDPQRRGYTSLSALSKQDHLTNVFSNVTRGMPLFNTSFNNGSITFTISNLSCQFYYNDNEQVQSLADDTKVNVTAGKLHMAFNFTYGWGTQKGTASGRAQADAFYFLKTLRLDGGVLRWVPVEPVGNITIGSFMSIMASEPKLPYDVKDEFEHMLNSDDEQHNHTSLKAPILSSLNTLYLQDLTYYLNTQQLFNSSTIVYPYKTSNLTVLSLVSNFTLLKTPTQTGLFYKVQFEVEGYQTKCNVLPEEYSTKYGGVQEYVGMEVWASMVLYGLKKGWLDVQLDRRWESEMFQMYAGDVANFIEGVGKLKADTPVNISCKWNNSQYDVMVSKYTDKSVFVSIPYSCSLTTDAGVKLQSLYFTLNFAIDIILHSDYIQTNTTYVGPVRPEFYREGDYIVTDKELGNRYVTSIANKVIGESNSSYLTGFPVINRKYPMVFVDREYTIFYDASEK